MKYKKILIKLSGEALKKNSNSICNFDYVLDVCKKIGDFSKKGYQVGIVVGGGNIWRGRDNTYIDSDISDRIGILSTTMNSLILHAAFNELGFDSKVLNSSFIEDIVDVSTTKKIDNELKNNNVLIFGGGTGKVGCSTDTAASQRAIDMRADVIVKLTNVDGVFDKDPDIYEDAKMYKCISYDEALEKKINVMDETSFMMCKENNIPIIVANIDRLGNIDKILNLEEGTIVE